jgi:outer membrane receptor for ferrienterochelin and colicins
MRKNGKAADVRGITFEIQSIIKNDFTLKFGATYQVSTYSSEVEWSAGDDEAGISPKYSDKILRTPDLYGYFLVSMQILEELTLDLSGYYTGPMYVPHYAGFIENDVMKKTDSFFDGNMKITYNIGKLPAICLHLGIQNLFNSFQDDFDKGSGRDAGYVYGPFRPFSTVFGIKLNY